MNVVFLDIDGVLLSGRAWALPGNNLDGVPKGGAHVPIMDVVKGVRFDPVAVALVNRLCERTGARLVVHSNWRRNVGLETTRLKLVEQGIDGGHFHEDWACRWKLSSDKGHDIHDWLQDHRLSPRPEEPHGNMSRKAEIEWSRANRDYGLSYVVLDDERIEAIGHVQVAIDEADGLGMAAYRHACGYLGGVDPQMGVVAVSAEDLDAVKVAWGGDAFRAAGWLHASQGLLLSHAGSLDVSRDRDDVLAGQRRRANVFLHLAEDTRHLVKSPGRRRSSRTVSQTTGA